MAFIADLHIHSRFSIATAKNLDLENIYIAAQLKGISVVGTGDFTHPGWLAEIKTKLVEDEPGLFKLDEEIARSCDQQVPPACRNKVRFILVSEISNIYKKNEKTRKNHNLVFMPDLETAQKFSARLDGIGNIKSDGRPILGLDAKHLLEIALETSDASLFVPAHIWTPWFSLLGSKSGFNSVAECFEDLCEHIHAVETGLSSDPLMNWRVSDLDGLTLISNSDAHSPAKLGREANLFDTGLSYHEIKQAIESGDPRQFLGTIEFFPEEGKYHFDGHRKCAVRLNPTETLALNGSCPVCGQPLTKGVLYRVEELADRPVGGKPIKTHPFYHLIPLTDILAELFKQGPGTKKVKSTYAGLLQKLGSELDILKWVPQDTIEKAGVAMLAEAIQRMRTGRVKILPGYDGEFGQIKLFEPDQRRVLMGQLQLFTVPEKVQPNEQTHKPAPKKKTNPEIFRNNAVQESKSGPQKTAQKINIEADKITHDLSLNRQQQRAVDYEGPYLLIVAGPGTGKTFTLTRRIARLLQDGVAAAKEVLAITFTNKAADQLTKRLQILLPGLETRPNSTTIHGLCHQILLENEAMPSGGIIAAADRDFFIKMALQQAQDKGLALETKPKKMLACIETAKQRLLTPKDDLGELACDMGAETLAHIYHLYQKQLQNQQLLDFDDLIVRAVEILEQAHTSKNSQASRFKHIFVDEYQDVNRAQYRLIQVLTKNAASLCVIGDPDQSIYGFRGSDKRYFDRFNRDYPQADVIHLNRNYRSTETILNVAAAVIGQISDGDSPFSSEKGLYSGIAGKPYITVMKCAGARAEAVAVGKTIEKLVGGTGFHALDFGKLEGFANDEGIGFADIAVLYRTHQLSQVVAAVLAGAGIPYQVVSRKNIFETNGLFELLSLMRVLCGFGSQADLSRIINEVSPGISKATWEVFRNWWHQHGYDIKGATEQTARFPIAGLGRNRQESLVLFLDKLTQISFNINTMTAAEALIFLYDKTKTCTALEADYVNNAPFLKLLDLAQSYGHDKKGFLISCAMHKDSDIYDYRAQKVSLMTLHAAKGLEFPVVFVVGGEDEYLPLRNQAGETTDEAEECRLFYVAVTRAKRQLYVSYALQRTINGVTRRRVPTPFLDAVDGRLLNYEQYRTTKPKAKHTQLFLFD